MVRYANAIAVTVIAKTITAASDGVLARSPMTLLH